MGQAMNMARVIVEKLSGNRYRARQALVPILCLGLADTGLGTVIISLIMFQGIERISIGDSIAIRDGGWLAAEGVYSSFSIGRGVCAGHRCHVHSIDPLPIIADRVLADDVMVTTADHGREDRHDVRDVGAVIIRAGTTISAEAVVVKDMPKGVLIGDVPTKELTSPRQGHALGSEDR